MLDVLTHVLRGEEDIQVCYFTFGQDRIQGFERLSSSSMPGVGAEVYIALRAIESAKRFGHNSIRLFTSSEEFYCGAAKWLPIWTKCGWRTSNGKPVSNTKLWQTLQNESASLCVKFMLLQPIQAAHQQRLKFIDERAIKITDFANLAWTDFNNAGKLLFAEDQSTVDGYVEHGILADDADDSCFADAVRVKTTPNKPAAHGKIASAALLIQSPSSGMASLPMSRPVAHRSSAHQSFGSFTANISSGSAVKRAACDSDIFSDELTKASKKPASIARPELGERLALDTASRSDPLSLANGTAWEEFVESPPKPLSKQAQYMKRQAAGKTDLKLTNNSPNVKLLSAGPAVQPVICYTDGACSRNGQSKAVAGIGVFFGADSQFNVSEPLAVTADGKQTNNRAEIMAVVRACQQLKLIGNKHMIVRTDSKFVIDSMTQWIKNWQRNGWRSSTGKAVENREQFELLLKASEGLSIQYEYVAGHRGIAGNEAADKLAREGSSKKPAVAAQQSSKSGNLKRCADTIDLSKYEDIF